ncbi:colicin E3/pyocin S6 family cytotoxin [Methylobacterium sp. J-070]|uniref:colicin E3/pyocin S6 family cytotoxin n=1 Tax=Methylobacterium sp. J-070 TaxID=2836650 RepID=UPI00391C892F
MVPPPRSVPGFPDAVRVRPKTSRSGGGLRVRWKDANGGIYEWDCQHGHVEKYDARGSHLGAFDAVTGEPVSRADSTRRVEP